MAEGHKKDNCRHRANKIQEVQVIQIEYFCQICQEFTPHETKDCPFNMKIPKAKWCAICEGNPHVTRNCTLNMKNKLNYHTSDLNNRPKATAKEYL